MGELIFRWDEKDSGRRITEARQAYFRSPFAGFDVFFGNRQEFWGKAESKNVVDVINQSMQQQMRVNQVNLGHHLYLLNVI